MPRPFLPPALRRPVALGLLLLAACGGEAPHASRTCGGGARLPPPLAAGPQVLLRAPDRLELAWRTRSAGAGVLRITPEGGVPRDLDADAGIEHRVLVEGLDPGTRYRYVLRHDGRDVAGPFSVTTPAEGRTSVRLVAVGDTGTGCPEAAAVIEAAFALDPDVVLHAGDAAYDDGRPVEVEENFLVPFLDLMAGRPLLLALGNHDVRTDEGAPILDALVLPTNDEDGSERYYATDVGPVHVVVLDSNPTTGRRSAMVAWLDRDLAATTTPWRVVLLHHPIYSPGPHGDDAALERDLAPLLERHHVDLVIAGHDHLYARSYPVVAGAPSDVAEEPDYVDPPGPVHVVTGGGGPLYAVEDPGARTAFAISAHELVLLEVDGPVLSLTARDVAGAVLDRATITKTLPPGKAR